MRVIFFGTSTFAVPSLEQLVAARHQVVMCVTQPDRPKGRGLQAGPSPVKEAARQLGLSLSQPERPQAELVRTSAPDIGIVVAYGEVIRPEVLTIPQHGMVGVHPSLLPKYRGAAPIAWALLNGETTTGVTVFRLTERLDAGKLLSQRAVAIEPEDDAEMLTDRLAQLGAQELVHALELIATGQVKETAQQESAASLAPKLTKAQGRIDWRQPSTTLERLIRALVPWPGAVAQWHGELLKIWKASARPEVAGSSPASPGSVVQVTSEGIWVATVQGVLEVKEVQPPGRRRMFVKEFLAGHPMCIGERFGSDE